ncbi:hypothetical protein UVI_02000650 [Ustilaginoidea virens]|nr:hypothetical protein UVI_02000650 [Ustilaginoidea virens]
MLESRDTAKGQAPVVVPNCWVKPGDVLPPEHREETSPPGDGGKAFPDDTRPLRFAGPRPWCVRQTMYVCMMAACAKQSACVANKETRKDQAGASEACRPENRVDPRSVENQAHGRRGRLIRFVAPGGKARKIALCHLRLVRCLGARNPHADCRMLSVPPAESSLPAARPCGFVRRRQNLFSRGL